MGSLLSSTDRAKKRQNRYLTNDDIQVIYLKNIGRKNDFWQRKLFKEISPIAISRIKKNSNILDREDLLQSVYLEIWVGIKSFDPHKNFDFYRWIGWHISRSIRNFKKAKTKFFSINLTSDSTSSVIFPKDDELLIRSIFDAQSGLADREKRIIYSYFFLGETLSEISEKERLSPEGVRKVRQKSIKKIRNKWMSEEGEYS